MEHEYWLKPVSGSERELADNWIEERPSLLRSVRFAEQPTGIHRGDYLVYYAGGAQKILAIARASSGGDEAELGGGKDQRQWPWSMKVQTLLAIPQVALAPHWSVLGIPSSTVTRQSHVRINREKYLIAQQAIAERTAKA